MTDKETARSKLAGLIDEFNAIAANTNLSNVSEKTARTWVERFLSAFGWNTSDPKEVRQEYRIEGRAARKLKKQLGVSHERPDYCLMANGRKLLYIDVKRFAIKLAEDSSVAYRVRCYGWSEGFRVSYASDFNELVIWDCRVKPDARDEADVARVLYIHHDRYLEHFDDLWDYVGREAILNGSLTRRHPDGEKRKGIVSMDIDFEEKLGTWRRELAKVILRYGKMRQPEMLSAAAQRILDRIIFLRICEEIGLEEQGTLYAMATDEDGFWPRFLESHENRWATMYDGILFPSRQEDDPTGVDEVLRSRWLKGRIFRELVLSLYYPNPYRFDVIPIELLGGIYERYLGKRLCVVGNEVQDEYKPEYQRTKGAIYTPPWVVRRVVEKTLAPLVKDRPPEAILSLRVLDPACGSASFLLGVFDFIEQSIFDWFDSRRGDPARVDYLVDTDGELRLTPAVVRRIIDECLFGVDIDPEAVEVARMSLALRYLDRTGRDESGEPKDLLRGIGLNVKHGNSLVGPEAVGDDLFTIAKDIKRLIPFDLKHATDGFGRVMNEGGFDAIVGNPPYIEVKRYREWMPALYDYLKNRADFKTAKEGKTDISVLFMERGVQFLKPGGRLGFIIQNRFFKTDYGRCVRDWLAAGRWIEEIEDFRDVQVFPDRTTYTAILSLGRNAKSLRYSTFQDLPHAERGDACLNVTIPWDQVDAEVWSFDQPDLLKVYKALVERHGTIGAHRDLSIIVGLQTLYGKVYQFEAREIRERTIVCVNGEGEEVILERKALRPLCRNRGFYPFRNNNADAWVIFPYDISEGQAREIEWKEFKERFPKAAHYLNERKQHVLQEVETETALSRWHLYTRPQNLVQQTRPKVLFPSTIEDTVASMDPEGDVYQDNVRINALISDDSKLNLMALAAVINSTPFDALAKFKAGLSEGGWRQFNRQFISLVPLPIGCLKDTKCTQPLVNLGRQIQDLQEELHSAKGEGQRQAIRGSLDHRWSQLDERVSELYGLTADERAVIARYPRRVSRVKLALRQDAVPEEEELLLNTD